MFTGKTKTVGSATWRSTPITGPREIAWTTLEGSLLRPDERPNSGSAPSRGADHFMKRVDLIKAIESFGCHLVRHRGRHDWYRNPVPHRISIASPKLKKR